MTSILLRRSFAGLLLLGSLLVQSAAFAQSDSALFDRPVLVVDPGRHTAIIRQAAVDASERLLVTGSDDKFIKLWSLQDGSLLKSIRVPAGPAAVGKMYAVAISPDGGLIAAGGNATGPDDPEHVYLFDSKSGVLRKRIARLPAAVTKLLFSFDGRYLAAALGGSGGMRVFDRDADWNEVARDSAYERPIYGLSFARDGRLAVSSKDGRIRLYDSGFSLQNTKRVSQEDPFEVEFSPDGTKLAVGYLEEKVLVVDSKTLEVLTRPDVSPLYKGNLGTVAWSHDGRRLIAGGRYGKVPETKLIYWDDEGRGAAHMIDTGPDTITMIKSLKNGDVVLTMADPALSRMRFDGKFVWVNRPSAVDFRDQSRTLSVSNDGGIVDFAHGYPEEKRLRFDVSKLSLGSAANADRKTAPPIQAGMKIVGYGDKPTLEGKPLEISRGEEARSLAIAPDKKRFVIGGDWYLRAFDSDGKSLWKIPTQEVVWASNISRDGRLVVAAYGDGTIRWHRLDDGRELLAFMPMTDRKNWIAWTPEGYYATSAEAPDMLKWHVNHGWDAAAETIPLRAFRKLERPDLLRRALTAEGAIQALDSATIEEIRKAVQGRTGEKPGPRLHILTVGIDHYGNRAKHIGLKYARDDAYDVADRLEKLGSTTFSKVNPQFLDNERATKEGITRALFAIRHHMASGTSQDLAILYFAGHGTMVDGEFYLLPFDVDARDPQGIAWSGLDATTLQRHFEKLAERGQRVLVLVDVCHSGAINGTAQPDAQKVSNKLASANITVLTSSSADQPSREDGKLKHGAFTFALLEGLGMAADVDRNQMISVEELAAHLEKRIPVLTTGAQTPMKDIRFKGDLFAVSR